MAVEVYGLATAGLCLQGSAGYRDALVDVEPEFVLDHEIRHRCPQLSRERLDAGVVHGAYGDDPGPSLRVRVRVGPLPAGQPLRGDYDPDGTGGVTCRHCSSHQR